MTIGTSHSGEADVGAFDDEAERIALRRRVLDWRDRWSIEAERRMLALCSGQADRLQSWASGLRMHELAAARTGFMDCPILPETIEQASALADEIISDARDALTEIIVHHLMIEAHAGRAGTRLPFDTDAVLAIGRGMTPFVAAGALLAALPAFATTTTVAMLGLISTSTVSLPVIAAGAAGIGALGYLGAINVGDLRGEQERVLVDAIEAAIEARLLAPERQAADRSLLAQMHRGIADAANDLVGGIA